MFVYRISVYNNTRDIHETKTNRNIIRKLFVRFAVNVCYLYDKNQMLIDILDKCLKYK